MEQLFAVLIIAAVVALIWLLSSVRIRRIQPDIDAFATAYCEAAEHILGRDTTLEGLLSETLADGRRRLLPASAQPEAIRALLQNGVDDYALARIRTMFELRRSAQAHLSAINLIGNRINGVLNRVYDLMNLSCAILNDPERTLSADEEQDFRFFLTQQAYLRNKTLAAVVSGECKSAIRTA